MKRLSSEKALFLGRLMFVACILSYPDLLAAQESRIEQYYLNAHRALQQGNPARTRDQLLELLKIKGDIPEVHNLLAVAYDRLGDGIRARKHFDLALRLKPDYVEARQNLALFLVNHGDARQAAFHFEKVAAAKPGDPQVLWQLGRVYFLSGQHQKSVETLQRIEASSPIRSREFYLTLALANERLDRPGAALEVLRGFLQASPEDVLALLEFGRIALAQGESKEVVSLLKAAAQKANEPDLHALLADAYLAGNDLPAAISEYERACDLRGDVLRFQQNLASLYLRTGDFRRSVEVLERIAAGSRTSESYNLLGSAYAKLGNVAAAKDALQKAIKLISPDPKPYYNLGLLLIREFKYAEAIDALNRARLQFPTSVELLLALSVAHQLKGEYGVARTFLKKITKLEPRSTDAYYYLGGSYLETGEDEAALAAFTRAHELNPGDFRVNYFMGWMALARGSAERAFDFFQQALRLKPDFGFARYQLAKIHMNRGELEKAIEECQKGIAADPTLAQMYYLLAQVYTRLARPKEAQEQLETYQRVKAASPEREYRVFIIPQ